MSPPFSGRERLAGSRLLLEAGQTGGVLHIHQGSLEEEAKLALEVIGLQEQEALERFYAGSPWTTSKRRTETKRRAS